MGTGIDDQALAVFEARLVGIEKDPFCAWLSQVMVDAALLPQMQFISAKFPTLIRCGDALDETGNGSFDLVVGNPPYGKAWLKPEQRARFQFSTLGHSSLQAVFLEQALRMTNANGVISYITPTSMCSGAYSKRVRALLRTDTRVGQLCFVDERDNVFQGATQTIALSSYRKGMEEQDVAVNQISMTSKGAFWETSLGAYRLPGNPTAPWLLPRSVDQIELVRGATALGANLFDWGYQVETGTIVWNRFKDRLQCERTENSVPFLWAESICSDGTFNWRADRKSGKRWFNTRNLDNLRLVRDPCVLLQRTTSTEQRRRLNAAVLPRAFLEEHGPVLIENHVQVIRAVSEDPAVSLETLADFLNSNAADQMFRCMSGTASVSATELRALPLPSPTDLAHLENLVRRHAPETDINAECRRLIIGT